MFKRGGVSLIFWDCELARAFQGAGDVAVSNDSQTPCDCPSYFNSARFDHLGRKTAGLGRSRNFAIWESELQNQFVIFVKRLPLDVPAILARLQAGGNLCILNKSCLAIERFRLIDAGGFSEIAADCEGEFRERLLRQGFKLEK